MKKMPLDERDLRSLRVFCAAAQASGFAAAERTLFMSKASISRHINEVEARLGIKLCERGPGGFQLTEGGEVALRVSLQALEALERIKPEVDAVRGVLSGPLVLGVSEHVLTNEGCHVAHALAELSRVAPLVTPTVKVMTTGDLGTALVERRVQIAIRGAYRRLRTFRHYPLFTETHRVFYRPGVAGGIAGDSDTRELPLVYRAHPFVEDALTWVPAGSGGQRARSCRDDGCDGPLCRPAARALCGTVVASLRIRCAAPIAALSDAVLCDCRGGAAALAQCRSVPQPVA
jgi:DNA-binding transcriptional LysR family regulator